MKTLHTAVIVVVLYMMPLGDACSLMADEDRFVSNIDFEAGIVDVGCFLHGERLEIGQRKTDYDHCHKCECRFDGLECCGFGVMGGTVDVEIPEGCKLIEKNCRRKLVQVDNENKLCNKRRRRGNRTNGK